MVFPTQTQAEAFLTFQTGGGLPALAPIMVQGQNVWGNTPQPQGTLLAQATVKAGVQPGTVLTFFCSQHGPNMNGSITAPAAAAATIEIDGQIVGGTPTWVQNGQKALGVTVNPGDTVVWKALNGTHGVVFPTQTQAEALLTFQTGGGLPALAPITVFGQNVWGSTPQPQGTLLAQATVKAGVNPGTVLTFFCSQHGPNMDGSLNLPGLSNRHPNRRTIARADPGGLDDRRIKRVVRAEVVALDQAFMCNRLGASMPQGMIFALKRDVVNNQNPKDPLEAGCVTLRPGKRARPIVLRANVGDCLEITFTNLLCPSRRRFAPPVEQPVTREAGVHVAGLGARRFDQL